MPAYQPGIRALRVRADCPAVGAGRVYRASCWGGPIGGQDCVWAELGDGQAATEQWAAMGSPLLVFSYWNFYVI